MSGRPDSFMPLFIGDYLADTGRLTTEGHGAYLLLLFEYWRAGEPLPNDDEQLASITRLPVPRWKKMRAVIERFFIVTDEAWRHKRVEEELVLAEERYAKQVARTKAATEARLAKQAESEVVTKNKTKDVATPVTSDVTTHVTSTKPQPQPQDPKGSKKGDAHASPGDPPSLDLVSPGPDRIRQAFDAFNTLAAEIGLPRAQKLDPDRRAKIGVLLREWGPDGWDRMLAGLRAWPHARGENDRGWRAELDYVLKPPKFRGLVERAPGTSESTLAGAPRAANPDHDPTWSPRLADFDRDGTWHEFWGPPPTDPGFQGPPRFRRQRAA